MVRRKMGPLVLVLMLCCTVAVPVTAQESVPLLDHRTRELLHESLSGERAKDHVIEISRHHRIQGSRGYRDAARYVLDQLREAGFSEEDAYIETFPSDGKIIYQTWQSPSGWHIESAELRMVKPYEERITGYPEIAMSVMTYSNAGHARGELVWVGEGTSDADYKDKDVAGKLVLCTGYGGAVHRLAVLKYGARAAICYLDDDRARDYPDMHQYTGIWPRAEELDRVTFGFNLTHRQGTKLRRLLEEGEEVVLDGRVEGPGLEPYFMDVVVAHIHGDSRLEEELAFVAHLDHPKESANDNASGSAALLDIARSLTELTGSKTLPQPARSFRFLWVPEFYGMMAYVDAHPEMRGPALDGRFLAAVNLDMVGEDLQKIPARMTITRTPTSIPSALNDVVENMAEMVDRMDVRTPRGSRSVLNYRVTSYSGGSDHNMFIDRKVPAMMISHSPDYTHHTSEDTPDKVDPVELERSALIATGALWYLANLRPEQALDLAYLVAGNAAGRLGSAGRVAHYRLRESTSADVAENWADAQNRLDHSLRWERDALRSILTFANEESVQSAIALMEDQLEAHHRIQTRAIAATAAAGGAKGSAAPALDSRLDTRVAARLTRGPLAPGLPALWLPPERAAWYASEDYPMGRSLAFELVNFVNGRRTVSEIRDALSAEFAPLSTEAVGRFLDDLVEIGVAEWRHVDRNTHR